MIKLLRQVKASPLDTARDRLASSATIADVIDVLAASAREIAGADGITVNERDGDEIICHAEDADAPLWAGRRFQDQFCVAGQALEGATTVLLPDIGIDPRVPRNAYLATFVKSMAIVPINTSSPRYVLGAYWFVVQPIPQAAVSGLEALAQAAAAAIERIDRSPVRAID